MENIQLWTESEDAIEAIISVGIPSLLALVFLVAGWAGGVELVARMRAVAKSLRKYIDETDDLLIIALEGGGELVLKRDIDPEQLVRLLTAVMDNASGETPPVEVNVGGAGK